MKTQPPLLPCPFCGSEAILRQALGEYWVECDNGHQGAMSQDPALAMFSWERRVRPVEKVIFRGYAVKWACGEITFREKKETASWIVQSLKLRKATIHRVRVVEIKPKKKAKK